MKRRTLLLLPLLGAPLAASGAAAAGTGVVILTDGRVAQYREALEAAQEALREAAVIDLGAADAAARVQKAAVILAIGQRAVQLAMASAPSVPVVTCMVLGGAVTGSRTLTGLRLEVSPDVQLGAFRRVHAGLKRLGVIYQPKVSGDYVAEAERAAGGLGISLVTRPVADARAVRSALPELAASIDALWLLPDPQLITPEMMNFLLVFTLERKLPLLGFFDSLTRAGALASVAPDYRAIGQRAAKLASELAARPAESRVPVPPMIGSPGTLSINLKTARQLGIEVPADVVAAANQVYR